MWIRFEDSRCEKKKKRPGAEERCTSAERPGKGEMTAEGLAAVTAEGLAAMTAEGLAAMTAEGLAAMTADDC